MAELERGVALAERADEFARGAALLVFGAAADEDCLLELEVLVLDVDVAVLGLDEAELLV